MSKVYRFSSILIGSAGAQAVSFIFLVAITKLYTPTEYGQFAAVILVHSTLLPVVLLRLDTMLIVAKPSNYFLRFALVNSVRPLVTLSVLSTLLFFAISSISPTYSNTIPQVYSAILVSFISSIANSILYHYSKIQYVIISSIIQAVSIGLLQVMFSQISVTSQSLLIAFIVGKLIGVLPCLFFLRFKLKNFYSLSQSVIPDLTQKSSELKLFSGWAKLFGFCDSLLSLYPVILCVIFFTSESLGLMMLILTIVYGPATMLGNSLTLSSLTSNKIEIESSNHSKYALALSRYKLTSFRLGVFYFISVNALIVLMVYMDFLNPDLTLVSLLALSAALQLANIDDFVELVINFKWKSLAWIYVTSFIVSSVITTFSIYLLGEPQFLSLAAFFLLKSILLFIGFRISRLKLET